MNQMRCLECDATLEVPADAIQGEIVTCRECGSAYELTREDGSVLFALKPAELEGEDWGE